METKRMQEIVKALRPIVTSKGSLDVDSSLLSFSNGIVLASNGGIIVEIFVPEVVGSGVIDGNSFLDYVKTIRGKEITIEITEKNLVLHCGGTSRAEFRLIDESVRTFPVLDNLPASEVEHVIEDANEWLGLLNQCLVSVVHSKEAGILNGIFVRKDGMAFSTDRYRLSQANLGMGFGDRSVVLPADTLQYLVNIDTDTFSWRFVDESKLMIGLEGMRIICCFLEGEYPESEEKINLQKKRCTTKIELSDDLRKVIRRHVKTQRTISDLHKREVLLSYGTGKLTALSKTIYMHVVDEISLEGIEGEPFEFAVNPEFVLDGSKEMWIDDARTAVLFLDEKFTHVVACRVK